MQSLAQVERKGKHETNFDKKKKGMSNTGAIP